MLHAVRMPARCNAACCAGDFTPIEKAQWDLLFTTPPEPLTSDGARRRTPVGASPAALGGRARAARHTMRCMALQRSVQGASIRRHACLHSARSSPRHPHRLC
jgi:hypothetical protein